MCLNPGHVSQRCVPGLQTIPCTPLQISCSLDSSLVLTTADQGGQVLTFGDNSLSQLGREDVHADQSPSDADAWALIDSDKKPLSALHITAGLSHAMAVLCSGQVNYSADIVKQTCIAPTWMQR